MRTTSRATVAFFMASALTSANAQPPEVPPGEGVICAWAIMAAMNEVGRRCYPGQHADVQATLRDALTRIDAYVVANATPPPTQDQIDDFKRRQGSSDATHDQVCRGDADQMYLHFVEQGAEAIRAYIDPLLARPGEPRWGTCL